MTSGSPCILDSDCNGTFLCYSELPWLEEEDSSCLCNTFYGWEGESCENLGSVSYFQIISITVQLVIIAVLLCLLVPLTMRLGAYLKRCCDSSFRTYLSWVFGIVCLCIWKICSLIVIVSPEQLTRTVELNSREETVNPITVIVEFPAAVATIIFAILCFINVTILCMWLFISELVDHLLAVFRARDCDFIGDLWQAESAQLSTNASATPLLSRPASVWSYCYHRCC